MPTYRVKSGDMDEKVKTPHQAEAQAIAFMAIHQICSGAANQVPTLGRLIEIKGGQYTGDNVVYVSTEQVLSDAGRLKR